MKKTILLVVMMVLPFYLQAQTTIGKTKDAIQKLIQSNPNFKLLAGVDCDTLVFAQGMQTVFFYKNNLCYKSFSLMPLKYMNAVIDHMKEDFYKKIKDDLWIDAKETLKVQITIDKNKDMCYVETTVFDKASGINNRF